MYFNGPGVKQNYQEAMKSFQLAFESSLGARA
jgi:hypothetical protein